MRNKYLYITLLSILAFHAEGQGQEKGTQVPRLVVNITIDQLQSDYLEIFAPYFGTEGFRKLMTDGMVFEHANHPLSEIDRASAISTVVTGTTPFYHGITGERWIDRTTLRPIYCTEDVNHPGIPSPIQLMTSTIGDELKVATEGKGKVFAVAPTADAAILSAGHAADGALWKDLQNGQWKGSQYYSNYEQSWLLSFNDLKKQPKKKSRHQRPSWEINSDITELAIQSINGLSMGQDSIPDLMNLTYDGSCAQETAYQCLDQALGRLITQIEQQTGKGHTLFILTSTGYHQQENIDYARYRIPTGTFYINRTANLLNMYFGAIWGHGRYVEACYRHQLYLNHKLLEGKQISLTEAINKAKDFILQLQGVKHVTSHLREQNKGDLTIEVAPGWHIQNEDTHEDYIPQHFYASFPIIIFGTGIQSGRVYTPVCTDRIAPAIAKAIRIRAPNACAAEPLF